MDYIVNTPCGPVKGCPGRVEGTVAYKGIRYATAGRWEYPKQVTAWDGTYDATEYGPCAYQRRAFEDESTRFYHMEFRKGTSYTYSEDCLFLNIWTPETAREGDALPVIFYIHGGSFTGGSGTEKHFDGPVWPREGVIGVTINYRLGPWGFLTLPELKEEAGITGNYGLFDQLTAMQWVKDNIASFGGDPENITIMGQSAGAMSVQQHVLSPLSKGLFQKAVMSSGGGVSKMMSAGSPEKNYAFWQAVMANCGCKTLAQFREVAPETLYKAWLKTKKEVKGGFQATAPCLDGKLVVGTGTDILSKGQQHSIPYMAGTTSEDMMPPIMYGMSKNWCKAQELPSYCWYFDRQLPGDKNGAWHSSDLWYWFGTLPNGWRPWEEKDFELSDLMVRYLCNFAKKGNPNGAGNPEWVACGERAMVMGEKKAHMAKPSTLKQVITMLTKKGAGEV